MVEYTHRTQYYETNQMGVIHHSNYIYWLEEARSAYLDSLQIPYHSIEKSGVVIPLLSIHCDYKSMSYFGDTLIIKVRLTEFNGVKFSFSYEIRDKKTDEIRAKASSQHCFTKRDGHPAMIKRELPALYGRLLLALNEDKI